MSPTPAKKRLCLPKETKAQTSAVPLLLPRTDRGHSLAGNGASRRDLLSVRSRHSEVMCSPLLPSALHQTAALWAGSGVLFLITAFYSWHFIRFSQRCQGKRVKAARFAVPAHKNKKSQPPAPDVWPFL